MKLKTRWLLLPMAIGSVAALPAMAADTLSAAQADSMAWFNLYERGDLAGLSERYNNDAVVLAPESTRLDGRAAIADYWGRVIKTDGKVSVAINAAKVEGSTMTQSGLWGVEMTTGEGETVREGGHLLRVLDKQADGSWKIRLESWN
jgi:ketosteroid isomerase-like protein